MFCVGKMRRKTYLDICEFRAFVVERNALRGVGVGAVLLGLRLREVDEEDDDEERHNHGKYQRDEVEHLACE